MTPAEHHLSVRGVARDIAVVYRRHWRFLIPTAIVVLLPQSLVDGLLDGLNVEGINSARDVAVLAAIPLTVAVNLLGQAVYAGMAAAAVVEWRTDRPLPKIGTLARSLPLGRLIVLDIVLSIGAAIGFVLLVVPGLVFLAYFSLSPPLVKFEHRSVRGGLKRSAQIVRGNFWRVLWIVVGVTLLTETVVAAISAPFHGVALVAAVDLASQGLLEPIEGLAIVLVAFRLLDLRGETPPPSELLRALTHRGAPGVSASGP
ncbi:MAG: hypothetical protein QOD14_678 [Solirubrobacterales bacterium]|jgi:hypothetical protein|nr:hypothetical protein [Solirubrobacterales bacterium]